jgi:LmbE family N-acetylglucosaminyl deacetylase
MPHKNRDARRAWETGPAQREKAAERQEAARERREELARLAAVWQIAQKCGHWRFCGPGLRAKAEARETEIRALLERQRAEAVEVWVDGKLVRRAASGA